MDIQMGYKSKSILNSKDDTGVSSYGKLVKTALSYHLMQPLRLTISM